jgi:hypothetical protein
MLAKGGMMTDENAEAMSQPQALDYFKFYEAAAEKTKAHAWSQTTWILTLNAGIMAFSTDFYGDHRELPGLRLIEGLAAEFIALCLFLVYLLQELGGTLDTTGLRQTSSRQGTWRLRPSSVQRMRRRHQLSYRADFPPSASDCRSWRPFLLGHAGWLFVVLKLVPR